MKLQRYYLCAAVVIGAAAILRADPSYPGDAPNGSTSTDPRIVSDCISEPSETHRVTFEATEGTSVVKDVFVKPGDIVKAGDPLMAEDTTQAEAELAIYKVASEAKGKLDQAVVTITEKSKLIDMLTQSIHSGKELLDAELERDQAIADKEQAEEDMLQRKMEYQRQIVKIGKMTLRSPIDGVVERVSLFAGEAVDANSNKDGACFVVNNNPLWVEVHLDAQRADKLKLSDSVDVSFPNDQDQWHSGKIIYLSPELDYVGQTRMVRLSVPNPQNLPSGQRVTVRLPESAVADASVKP